MYYRFKSAAELGDFGTSDNNRRVLKDLGDAALNGFWLSRSADDMEAEIDAYDRDGGYHLWIDGKYKKTEGLSFQFTRSEVNDFLELLPDFTPPQAVNKVAEIIAVLNQMGYLTPVTDIDALAQEVIDEQARQQKMFTIQSEIDIVAAKLAELNAQLEEVKS